MFTSHPTVRTALLLAVPVLLLILLMPLIMLGVGLLRERSATRGQVDLLHRVPLMTNGWDPKSAEIVGAREGVIIARLDPQGGTVFRTGSVPLVAGSGGPTLDAVDSQMPPWPTREEVRAALAGNRTLGRHRTKDGSALVLTLAQPLPEGGALYVLTGSRASALRRLPIKVVSGLWLVTVVSFALTRRRRH